MSLVKFRYLIVVGGVVLFVEVIAIAVFLPVPLGLFVFAYDFTFAASPSLLASVSPRGIFVRHRSDISV